MRKAFFTISLVTTMVVSSVWNGQAVGSVRGPTAFQPPREEAAFGPAQKKAPEKKAEEKKPSFVTRLRESFARFRPVEKKNSHLDQADLLGGSTIERVYDREMSEKMNAHYMANVAPLAKEASGVYGRSSRWDVQRYEQSRKDMANWALKEVGKDQLNDFLRKNKDSSAVNVMATATGKEIESDQSRLTEEEKIYQAQRQGIPYRKADEVVIPTRLKAKMNVLKARGQLTFSNPVVITSVEGGAGSGSNFAVEMNRAFQSIDMNSRVRYGVDESVLLLNVNKKITEEVSVDLNSERWTSGKRSDAGQKRREAAKVTYSISF